MNIINPAWTRPSPPFLQTSNQNLIPVNQPLGQLTLERTQNLNLIQVNQVLGRLSVEGIRNQEMTIENVNFLIDGMLGLQELAQSQASELLLVKEQLRTAQQNRRLPELLRPTKPLLMRRHMLYLRKSRCSSKNSSRSKMRRRDKLNP